MREESAAYQHGDELCLVGGHGDYTDDLPIDCYDVVKSTWWASTQKTSFHHVQPVIWPPDGSDLIAQYPQKMWVITGWVGGWLKETEITHVLTFDRQSDTINDKHCAIDNGFMRGSAAVAAYGEAIYAVQGAVGGHDPKIATAYDGLDRFDPRNCQWKHISYPRYKRDHVYAAIVGHIMYVAGGRSSNIRVDGQGIESYEKVGGKYLFDTIKPNDAGGSEMNVLPMESIDLQQVENVLVMGGDTQLHCPQKTREDCLKSSDANYENRCPSITACPVNTSKTGEDFWFKDYKGNVVSNPPPAHCWQCGANIKVGVGGAPLVSDEAHQQLYLVGGASATENQKFDVTTVDSLGPSDPNCKDEMGVNKDSNKDMYVSHRDVQVYDIKSMRWDLLSPMYRPRHTPGAGVFPRVSVLPRADGGYGLVVVGGVGCMGKNPMYGDVEALGRPLRESPYSPPSPPHPPMPPIPPPPPSSPGASVPQALPHLPPPVPVMPPGAPPEAPGLYTATWAFGVSFGLLFVGGGMHKLAKKILARSAKPDEAKKPLRRGVVEPNGSTDGQVFSSINV